DGGRRRRRGDRAVDHASVPGRGRRSDPPSAGDRARNVLLRWFMPQIVFYGVGAVAGGLLTANRRFAAQMYAPVLNNLAVIVTMFALIAMRGTTPPRVETLTLA